jgi:inositol oxygenase
MDVWEGLALLNSLREYEAALVGADGLDPDMPLMEHALQTAEACRLAFPQHEWAGVVGLIHGLGKLLAHVNFGAEPQWAVCGESFPVGCRFHPAVIHSQYFQANPDRRRRAFAGPTGMYQPGCGLANVCMSWSAAEYLYMILAHNRTALPPEALFLIRYQKFKALLRSGKPYGELLSAFDRSMLPMLERFQQLAAYRRADIPNRLEGQDLRDHYDALLRKYIPQGRLRW